ncbi:benzoate 4-monooxygenase cytochrome P450 [Pseudovirgaria hyperparasitica]|uniref:Benzoate 4-monooxygenase cytochrome P450 n=1 Tax=Pseudovirgaria hyperparasitica TaxID=470096 RepID=A0A6A6W9Y6_9PEZI|nr:benzoate 4-monooxygenase cytochrome P450 [Pseudovirgaria hyperparasitica]KAF2758397.1 benzoate 4-monooxygenase cytochrome P450 [Pseudovirgaria hyperparasitica]
MLLAHSISVLHQHPYWTLTLAALLSILVKAVYNVFFHPLARVPGPILCKLSGLPSFYHAVKGDHHVWLWQLHQVYGTRIRPRPDRVLFNDPAAYNDIYNAKANVQKAPSYRAYINGNTDVNTTTTIEKAAHTKKRRLLNLAFNEKSLRAAAVFIIKHVDRWNDLLMDRKTDHDGWTEGIDFADWTDKLVFDIMADLSFGKPFDIKEPGENSLKRMPHNLVQYMTYIYPISRIPVFDLILWLKPRGLDALLAMTAPPDIKAYFKFVAESVNSRIAKQEALREKSEGEQRLDVFHFLYEAIDPETGARAYKDSELLGEANLLILAGTDTTSITLCGIFFYLTHYPHQYAKLVQEIRETFGSYHDIVQGQRLSECSYLRACIDESLRLTPAAPSELPREVLQGGAKIGDEFYPEGVVVGTADWAQSRDEAIWGDAHVFRPERWLPDAAAGISEQDVAQLKKQFHPFSQGPYNCVGKNLAMLELMIVVARTLHRYDVRRVEGATLGEGRPDLGWGRRDRNQFQLRDAFISVRYGPMVQFRSRT